MKALEKSRKKNNFPPSPRCDWARTKREELIRGRIPLKSLAVMGSKAEVAGLDERVNLAAEGPLK